MNEFVYHHRIVWKKPVAYETKKPVIPTVLLCKRTDIRTNKAKTTTIDTKSCVENIWIVKTHSNIEDFYCGLC